MYSLNDSPLSTIVNTLDQGQYNIKKDEGADGSEAYILTHATTGVRIRIQAGGDPEPLNICGEDTDTDDWGELSTDPETAINEITDFAAWLAARTER